MPSKLANYSQQDWDAVVIGAGPAGASVARLLAKQKKRKVLLIDESDFPRIKVCGCCVNAVASGILASTGLANLLVECGAKKFSQLMLHDGRTKASISLPTGFALSRAKLDAAIVDAAQIEGVEFVCKTRAVVLQSTGETRDVSVTDTYDSVLVKAKVVIVSDGIGGTSLKNLPEFAVDIQKKARIGAGMLLEYTDVFYEQGRIFMACSDNGYVGLVRVEGNQLDVAVALDRDFSRSFGSVADASAAILQHCELPVPDGFISAKWSGTGALTRRRKVVAAERLFVLGDACGYTEPFTGEGIAWSLLGAVELADLANSGIESWSSTLADAWQRNYSKTIGNRQKYSLMIANLLKNSWLRRGLIQILASSPQLAAPLMMQPLLRGQK